MSVETAVEQVRLWDAGESVFTVEMGGLGPGYEQAIQVLAIEIMRDEMGKPLPVPGDGTYRAWGDATVARIDYRKPDGTYACGGFSGAQAGAAKQIAYQFLRDGPEKAMADIPDDRKILVSNRWPRVEAQA